MKMNNLGQIFSLSKYLSNIMISTLLVSCSVCLALSGDASAAWPIRDTLSLDKMTVTRDRPLFSPSRRPPPVAQPDTPPPLLKAPSSPPPDINVTGIIIGPSTSTAVVAIDSDSQAYSLGDKIDGWTLSDIKPTGIVLSLGARHEVFALPQPEQ